MTFPAVTFCNLNRISCAQLKSSIHEIERSGQDDDNLQILQDIFRAGICPPSIEPSSNFFQSSENFSSESKAEYPKRSDRESQNSLFNRRNNTFGTIGSAFTTGTSFHNSQQQLNNHEVNSLYMKLSESIKIRIGHQLRDFMKDCEFGGFNRMDEIEMMFETTTNPTYGNCFTFNSNLSGYAPNLFRSFMPGPMQGLSVVLNLEQSDYTIWSASGAGARL